jgi:tetratricopeptide (TPR) repeat protein
VSNTGNKEKLIAAAQKLVEKGQFDKAVREYLKVVAEDDTDIRIWIRIGDLYVKIGQKNEAIENYKKVAQLYLQQNDSERAIAVYKQILHIDPASASTTEIHMILGGLYRDMNRAHHATQQFELAAQQFAKAGRTRDALRAEQTIVDLTPDNMARRVKLAEMYSKEGLVADAAREFSAVATYLRGVGRVDDAAKVSERQLFLSPENLEVIKDLARYYLKQGDAMHALTKLQQGFKVDRKDVELLDLLAQSFERSQKKDKAVQVLRELARIYAERGAMSAANGVYQRVLELDPNDETAKAALSQSKSQPPPRKADSRLSDLSSGKFFNSPAPQPVPHPGPSSSPGLSGERLTPMSIPMVNQPTQQLVAPTLNQPTQQLVAPTLNQATQQLSVAAAVSAAVTPAVGTSVAQLNALSSEEESARVVAETDSFLRLGLHRKALEHLQTALASRPSDKLLRDRLARLYESRGDKRAALTEWRTLLGQAMATYEQTRYLREIVRMDAQDESAASRLRSLVGQDDDSDDEPEITVSRGSEASGPAKVTPPTDITSTTRMPLTEFSKFAQNQQLTRTMPPPTGYSPAVQSAPSPSQSTAPNHDAVAAAAEEMALTSGTLKEELDEVEFFLQQKMKDEARQLLNSLAARYPHSKTVQAKFAELQGGSNPDVVTDAEIEEVADVAEIEAEPSGRHVATPPPRPVAPPPSPMLRKSLPPPPLVSARSLPIPATGVVAPSMGSLSGGHSLSSRSLPPQPPSRTEKTAASSEASGAFRLGISYRNRGQYAQAVTEFQKAMQDNKRAARAALMLGLCHRDQNQVKEAIEAFKEGIHMPGISEPDLCELHYQLGRSYEQLGDVKEATHFYQQSQKPSGRFKDADARLQALASKSSRSLK